MRNGKETLRKAIEEAAKDLSHLADKLGDKMAEAFVEFEDPFRTAKSMGLTLKSSTISPRRPGDLTKEMENPQSRIKSVGKD